MRLCRRVSECAASAQYAPAGLLQQQPSGQLLLPRTYHTLMPKLGHSCRIVGTMALVALVIVLLLLAACHQFIRSAQVQTGRVICFCTTIALPSASTSWHAAAAALVSITFHKGCGTSLCWSLLMPSPFLNAAAICCSLSRCCQALMWW